MNRPKATQSNEILTYLKEENSFLKEELKDTRDLIKNILENININHRRQKSVDRNDYRFQNLRTKF